MPTRQSRETGGADPLDARFAARPPSVLPFWLAPLLHSSAALGLRPVAAPAIVFVPLGLVLGPRVAGVLGDQILAHLDVVVSVALAALGIFVGLALELRSAQSRLALAAASVEAVATVLIVGAALALLLLQWGMPTDGSLAIVALVLGIAASASSAGSAELLDDPVHRAATRLADLDDVLPIVLGGLVIAAAGVPGWLDVLRLGLVSGLIGLGLGVAGWLLFERAESPAERAVFVLGAVMLVAGASAHLGLSPLLAGLIAGTFWKLVPGRADAIIGADLQKIQHPVVVLLLLVAGATLDWSRMAVWLFAPFVLFRVIGKLVGGMLATRLSREVAPADLGAYLIPPGVFGIAFALNYHQVAPSATSAAIVAAVAAGSLACEILAMLALFGGSTAEQT